MALAGWLGLEIDLGRVLYKGIVGARDINTILLFSESASRFLVEVSPGQRDAFEAHMQAHNMQDVTCIGTVTAPTKDLYALLISPPASSLRPLRGATFIVRNGEQVLIDIPVTQLQEAWKGEEV